MEPGKAQTILMIGDDRRKSEVVDAKGKALKDPPPTRSDTMILVRLDPSKGATALMSLPRDLVVDIPGHGRATSSTPPSPIGEDKLTLRTVRQLLDIPIHHYIRVTFGGFRGAVDRLGCVYTDVDRRYFNDNNPPNGGGADYATIDVDAGYQKLCGQDALDYVRYRHFDNDLVRAARQQSFLRRRQEPDRRERRLRRPRAAAADLRAVRAHGHRRHGRDPEPAQARRGVLEQARAGGPVPRHGRRATARVQISRHRPAARPSTASWT